MARGNKTVLHPVKDEELFERLPFDMGSPAPAPPGVNPPAPMEFEPGSDVTELRSEQLRQFTDGFSQDNFLGNTQFGMFYRGKILCEESGTVRQVAVKIYHDNGLYIVHPQDKFARVLNEIRFLQDPSVRNHSNLVKVWGYARDVEPIGLVYDINPLDTLHNLVLRDDFSWSQRIKVALGLSRLLDFLHSFKLPYMVRNLDPAHILIDQNFTPLLSDFGMLLGGMFGMDRNPFELIYGAWGYIDPDVVEDGVWTVQIDVYEFGSILLTLISKRLVDLKRDYETDVARWARYEYHRKSFSFLSWRSKPSLVHKSFKNDPMYSHRDACKITDLAVQCVNRSDPIDIRPTMKKIIKRLQALDVLDIQTVPEPAF